MTSENVVCPPLKNGGKPSAKWYVLSLVLFLVFGIGGIFYVVFSFLSLFQDGVRFVVPGELILDVERTGKYTLYNETYAVFNGKVYPGSTELPETVSIRITELSTEQSIPLDPTHSGKITVGSNERFPIGTIRFEDAGSYLIRVSGDFHERVFSVRRASCGEAFALLVVFLFAGLVGWIGAPVLAIIIFAKRSSAKRMLSSEQNVTGVSAKAEAVEGSGVERDYTTWALFCHLGAFAGYFFPFANIIVPLIIWLVKKDESEFVDDQGRESVNFQISMLIYVIVSALLSCILIGIVLLAALGVFNMIVVILASIKASKGERYRYPLSIRFIRQH